MPDLMPTIFLGDGNPMNAISENAFTDGWRAIGWVPFPRPKAILALSAQWHRMGVRLQPILPHVIHTTLEVSPRNSSKSHKSAGQSRTRITCENLLAPAVVELDESWGLDHGTWSVLCHVFKDAEIPVVQLAINRTQPPEFHYEIGKRLSSLRENGILVIGSGNIVHNLSMIHGEQAPLAFDWAERFEKQVRESLTARDDARLIAYDRLGHDAKL